MLPLLADELESSVVPSTHSCMAATQLEPAVERSAMRADSPEDAAYQGKGFANSCKKQKRDNFVLEFMMLIADLHLLDGKQFHCHNDKNKRTGHKWHTLCQHKFSRI